EDQQAPARVVVVLVQEDVEHVLRAAEELLGIRDVVEVAPSPPLPRERPKGVRLPGPWNAVPEDQPAGLLAVEPAPGERPDSLRDRPGVVVRDLRPGGHRDRA